PTICRYERTGGNAGWNSRRDLDGTVLHRGWRCPQGENAARRYESGMVMRLYYPPIVGDKTGIGSENPSSAR
ncbi:MAG: hypothetical protein ABIR47_02190, partial [Candidatus Kapaibacterium sp.]